MPANDPSRGLARIAVAALQCSDDVKTVAQIRSQLGNIHAPTSHPADSLCDPSMPRRDLLRCVEQQRALPGRFDSLPCGHETSVATVLQCLDREDSVDDPAKMKLCLAEMQLSDPSEQFALLRHAAAQDLASKGTAECKQRAAATHEGNRAVEQAACMLDAALGSRLTADAKHGKKKSSTCPPDTVDIGEPLMCHGIGTAQIAVLFAAPTSNQSAENTKHVLRCMDRHGSDSTAVRRCAGAALGSDAWDTWKPLLVPCYGKATSEKRKICAADKLLPDIIKEFRANE